MPKGNVTESEKVLIDIAYDIDDITLASCLEGVEFVYSRLDELYGNSPDSKYILLAEDEFAVTKPIQLTVPFGLYPERGCDDPLVAHKTSHWFTFHIIPTSESWFNEGLASVAEHFSWSNGGYRSHVAIEDFRHSRRWTGADPYSELYEMLKNGENIFRYDFGYDVYEKSNPHYQYKTHGASLNAHNVGALFFIGLELDYELSGSQIKYLLQRLASIIESKRLIEGESAHITRDDLIEAAQEIVGKDVARLFALLEPSILFNSYVFDDYKDRGVASPRVLEFFDQYPQYNTERVSWQRSH